MKRTSEGVQWVVSAYVAWGILPIFWSLLRDIDSLTVLVQRTAWSAFFLGSLLMLQGDLLSTLKKLFSFKELYSTAVSSSLLALNWFSYLWAMQQGELFTASMAYYLSPLLTVAGAAYFFGEKITKVQLLSLSMILVGVSLPLVIYGSLPWMALVIGGTWSGYVLWRRTIGTPPLVGIFCDVFFLTLLLLTYSVVGGGFDLLFPRTEGWETELLFPLSGIATAVPMVWLVKGMRSTPLSLVGILQYVAPTLTLCSSVVYFQQNPTMPQMVTLLFVWGGLMVYFSPYLLPVAYKVMRSLSISPPPVA
jgi:chloramphenicol-sensitive protein RarD